MDYNTVGLLASNDLLLNGDSKIISLCPAVVEKTAQVCLNDVPPGLSQPFQELKGTIL